MSIQSARLKRWIRRPRLISASALAIITFAIFYCFLTPIHALLIGFDVGIIFFVGLMFFLMCHATTNTMHHQAKIQEEGKWMVLLASLTITGMIVIALISELHGVKQKALWDIILAASSIFLAWFFIALIFSQQYAHSFYIKPNQLEFPKTPEPNYWDFLYFALVLSMCCQTSDVLVTSTDMRRLVMLHSVISFFFNVIIIALTINILVSNF